MRATVSNDQPTRGSTVLDSSRAGQALQQIRRNEHEPVVVQAFITLDGVVQAGGGPDEDRDGGFEHGGWMMEYDGRMDTLDEGGQIVEEWESKTEALLLGRRTYEIFAGSWGVCDEDAEGFLGDLTRRYNRIPKYVASRTLTAVGWQNSQLLGPDVPAAVELLRAQPGGEIRVWEHRADQDAGRTRPHRRIPARCLPARVGHGQEAVLRRVRARTAHPRRDPPSGIGSAD
jgi:dihydrofolate reductase